VWLVYGWKNHFSASSQMGLIHALMMCSVKGSHLSAADFVRFHLLGG
jgi:hypothetical protein